MPRRHTTSSARMNTPRLVSRSLALPGLSRGNERRLLNIGGAPSRCSPFSERTDASEELVDDGGDANLLMHKGTELEPAVARDETSPDPVRTTNPVFKSILQLIKDCIPTDATKWTNMVKLCKGVIEEMTTGVLRLRETAATGDWLFADINVHGCRHSLNVVTNLLRPMCGLTLVQVS